MSSGHSPLALEKDLGTSARQIAACRHCDGQHVFRIFREGFFQNKIYPLFGYYPWKCKDCGEQMMLRKRRRGSRKKQYAKEE